MHINLYSIYCKMYENDDQKDHKLGRILILDNKIYKLEDHHNAMEELFPEKLSVNEVLLKLQKLSKNPYFLIKDFNKNQSIDLDQIPILNSNHESEPIEFHNVSWLYCLNGMEKYHTLSFNNGIFYMDSKPLENNEVSFIINSLNNNQAKLKYMDNSLVKNIDRLTKDFNNLYKKEDEPLSNIDPEDALAHLDSLVAQGHLDPLIADSLRQHIFTDPRTPGVGNKYAWERFRSKNKPGIYASLDLNNLKNINDVHGHEAGDKAISAFGRTMRESADEIGKNKTKIHMTGGDEASAYFESPEDAHLFVRKINQKLNSIPPINGTHKLSTSVGLGSDFSMADKALHHAKKQKFKPESIKILSNGELDARNSVPAYESHNMPSFAHSLLPGQEGLIDLGKK